MQKLAYFKLVNSHGVQQVSLYFPHKCRHFSLSSPTKKPRVPWHTVWEMQIETIPGVSDRGGKTESNAKNMLNKRQ